MKDNKKHKSKCGIIIGVIAVLLIAGGVFMLYLSGTLNNLEFGLPEKLISDSEELAPPEVTVYLEEGSAVEPDKITDKNLKSPDGFDSVKTLYDGDESTCIDCEDGSAVLDAGEMKSLSYIKYTPNCATQDAANSCIGTRFYASKDNKTFVELGRIMPDINGDLSLQPHIIEFSGYGRYRYFKVEPTPHASLSEIEWVCLNGLNMDDSGKTTIDFTAYQAQHDYDAFVTFAVYNRAGVLKTLETLSADILVGEYTPIEFSGADIELGDRIKIDVFDSANMKPLTYAPLEYRYTEASSSLSLSNVYSDNMMFQADEELVLRGKAPEGSVVTAELIDDNTSHTVRGSATARNFDEWKISLGSFENGGSYTLKITADDEELTYKNITFGDVWVFAGQSNMEFYLCGEESGEKLLKSRDGKQQATSSDIRLINLYGKGTGGAAGEIENVPLNDWNGYWSELSPESAAYVSAISYYFAKGLNARTGRNIGIISVAVGDTEINRWYPKGEVRGSFEGTDGRLYNSRIYPFLDFKIKGILWYQGEADMYRTNMNAEEYSDAMAGLVDIYREKWNKPDLPFYYAQVTRYGAKDESEIREGQRIALRKIAEPSNTGMVTLLDIIGRYEQDSGCARTDIHPWQKETVADRFLAFAMRDSYGGSEAVSGPEYESSEISGSRVIISFRHTGSLRVMDKSRYADSVCDDKIKESGIDTSVPHEFWIADKDGKLYPAEARIENDKVAVWSDEVDTPAGAVYAWGAYPEMPNLTDDTGLPTSTFDTRNK